ncbi:MAG: hypothetical protein ACK2U9_01060 [Anaerolineae bacterium]
MPFAEMVTKLALAVAEGQTALDMNSTRVATFMASQKINLPSIEDPTKTVEFPLIALGFFPGYYQFQEAIIEVKMAITMATTRQSEVGASATAGWGPFSASVNASYSQKYEYKAEGSSLLRVKLAPVPPPALLQEYIETLVDGMSESLRQQKASDEEEGSDTA